VWTNVVLADFTPRVEEERAPQANTLTANFGVAGTLGRQPRSYAASRVYR
jgi:hypothetical protein